MALPFYSLLKNNLPIISLPQKADIYQIAVKLAEGRE
jgi:hypothetical protein